MSTDDRDHKHTFTNGDPEWRAWVKNRFEEIEAREKARDEQIEENTKLTKASLETSKKTAQDTQQIIDLFDKVSSGFRVLGGIGKAGEWLLKHWLAIVALYVVGKIVFTGGTWKEAMEIYHRLTSGGGE